MVGPGGVEPLRQPPCLFHSQRIYSPPQGTEPYGARSGTRTRTGCALNALTLPIGLSERGALGWIRTSRSSGLSRMPLPIWPQGLICLGKRCRPLKISGKEGRCVIVARASCALHIRIRLQSQPAARRRACDKAPDLTTEEEEPFHDGCPPQ